MQRRYEQILTAVSDGDLVGALDADEAMLGTLYRASGNSVLTDLIRGLWQCCRAYKITGARRARRNDQRAAAALTEESLRSPSRRIQTLQEKQRASASKQD